MQAHQSKFKKVRNVTIPLIKIENDELRYFFFKGAMHEGKKIDEKDPAILAHVIDLESGQEGQIICPTILVKELNENYGGNSYVGKSFEIVKTRVPEKRYNIVTITEVATPEEVLNDRASVEVLDAEPSREKGKRK